MKRLGADGLSVEEQAAGSNGAKVGESVYVTTGEGAKAQAKHLGEYRDPSSRSRGCTS